MSTTISLTHYNQFTIYYEVLVLERRVNSENFNHLNKKVKINLLFLN